MFYFLIVVAESMIPISMLLHMFVNTCHTKMQLLHDNVILEVWISSEVEANPVAQFVILERLNLKKDRRNILSYTVRHTQMTIL